MQSLSEASGVSAEIAASAMFKIILRAGQTTPNRVAARDFRNLLYVYI